MEGFKYKILKVNLTTKETEIYIVPDDIARNFVGGRGLGAKLLWDNHPAGMDPLAEESPIFMLTGPLTGMAPGGAQLCVIAKSPETKKTLTHALTGAQFAVELRFAGYDGLWITGQSQNPVYLYIKDSKVEIRDAQEYWGLDAFETPMKLKENLKDNRMRILCIGSAGENLVKYASIQQEYFRSAARGGSGTIMGSKKLKAIVVRGTGSLSAQHQEEFMKLWYSAYQKFMPRTKVVRAGYNFGRYGSIAGQISCSDVSQCAVRNYREGYWDEMDKVSGVQFERRLKIKSRGCFSCPIGCMQIGKIRDGEWKGTLVSPDFDSSGTIGPNLLLNSIEESSYISRLGDQYGIDDASLGNVLGFVTECYEKGLITKEDLNGIDIGFAKVDEYIKLVEMIAKREGYGDFMAEGVKYMSDVIKKGSEFFAMHAKGMEYAGYAPHGQHNRALQYAVGDRGGCHHFGLTFTEQNMRAMMDSLTCCAWNFSYLSPEIYMNFLNAITGFDYDQSDWSKLGERIVMMARMYNIREGMVPMIDDVLPRRIHEEPQSWGPKVGSYYPKEKFEEERNEWYMQRGCDEFGIPKIETLQNLGLL